MQNKPNFSLWKHFSSCMLLPVMLDDQWLTSCRSSLKCMEWFQNEVGLASSATFGHTASAPLTDYAHGHLRQRRTTNNNTESGTPSRSFYRGSHQLFQSPDKNMRRTYSYKIFISLIIVHKFAFLVKATRGCGHDIFQFVKHMNRVYL